MNSLLQLHDRGSDFIFFHLPPNKSTNKTEFNRNMSNLLFTYALIADFWSIHTIHMCECLDMKSCLYIMEKYEKFSCQH